MIKANYFKNTKNEIKNNSESNKELPHPALNKSFCSMDSINQNNNNSLKIINKKRLRQNSNNFNNFLIEKINKLQKSQNSTNLKLDILLNIIKAKLYGEYSYEISHNDFFIQNSINNNIKNAKDEKEDSLEYNISEDTNTLTSIKKEPPVTNSFINNKFYNINDKNEINLINENKDNKIKNLCNNINDTLAMIQKEKNKLNVHKNLSDPNILKTSNNNVNESPIAVNDNKIKSNNNSLNKEINLNKYKIDPVVDNTKENKEESLKENESKNIEKNKNENMSENKIETVKNSIQDSIEKPTKVINIQENNDVEINLEEEKMSNLPLKTEDNEFSIININEEKKINNEKKEEANKKEEDEKEASNSQCDNASVRSSISNVSGTKSNHSSSRRIRGFNFRNNINIKKYNRNIHDNVAKK